MDKKNNLAFIIPTLNGGGAERVLSNITLNLPEEIKRYVILHDASLISYDYKGDLIDLDTPANKNIVIKFYNFIKRFIKISKIKKQYNIKKCISFLTNSNILNLITNRGEKSIISVRVFKSKSNNLSFYGKINKILMKLLYNSADLIVPVSEVIKHDLINTFEINESKIKVVYNPYNIEEINELGNCEIEEKYRHIFKDPVLINMGRLSKQKNQKFLIKAFKKVQDKIPNINLVILGEGNLKDELINLTNELNLNDNIYFLGFQDNPFKYIKKSDLFILTSLFEGFPNALVEAMSLGIPVISTDCKSGPREILAPETNILKETQKIEYCKHGILIPDFSNKKHKGLNIEDMLAKSIVKLFNNKRMKNKYSDLSLKRANDFKIDKIINEWIEIID